MVQVTPWAFGGAGVTCDECQRDFDPENAAMFRRFGEVFVLCGDCDDLKMRCGDCGRRRREDYGFQDDCLGFPLIRGLLTRLLE